ncbi:glutathione transferase GST 23 [Citrus clementina]|uniref:glutathione transferase GST 23 n=1 Tax=Citrus clementina TaxID=85681 RepID=UPI000CECF70A|nr:glutathione transferase GST 23 [Citrus x clementina]
MTTKVKLLGFWCSPFAFRVVWALKLKGVEFEYIEEDIFNKSTELLELNPVHKKVPVLVHDKRVIVESFVILEYIDETWPQDPLLPQDPYEKAMARFWAKFGDEKLLESAYKAMWSKGEEKQKAMKEAVESLEKIEEVLRGKNFMGGNSIGYLDLAIGWIGYWIPVWEEAGGSMRILDSQKFPAIAEWSTKFQKHPVIKENLPPRDRTLAYCHKRAEEIYANFCASEN